MKKNILFRVDYSNKIGFGHLTRCLNLASLFIKHNYKVTLLTKSKKINNTFNLSNKIKIIYFKKNSINKEAKILLETFDKEKIDYLILDIENSLISKNEYEIFLSQIELILRRTICWDNNFTNKFLFGLTYRPYPNFINLLKLKKKQKILSGLHNLYFPKFEKNIIIKQKEIKNILLLLSGSNQNYKLKQILNLLSNFKSKHKYNFIVYSKNKINFLKNLNKNHNFVLKNDINIHQIHHNIDLAIIGGGMIKYECIMYLIPSIIINLDLKQKKTNSKINKMQFGIIVNHLSNLLTKLNKIMNEPSLIRKIIKNYSDIRKKYNEKKILLRLLNNEKITREN